MAFGLLSLMDHLHCGKSHIWWHSGNCSCLLDYFISTKWSNWNHYQSNISLTYLIFSKWKLLAIKIFILNFHSFHILSTDNESFNKSIICGCYLNTFNDIIFVSVLSLHYFSPGFDHGGHKDIFPLSHDWILSNKHSIRHINLHLKNTH